MNRLRQPLPNGRGSESTSEPRPLGSGEPVLATPAWADDMLIVRGTRHLFAIAEKP
jgi:hypothetical protein